MYDKQWRSIVNRCAELEAENAKLSNLETSATEIVAAMKAQIEQLERENAGLNDRLDGMASYMVDENVDGEHETYEQLKAKCEQLQAENYRLKDAVGEIRDIFIAMQGLVG